jgi:hypothetical protein
VGLDSLRDLLNFLVSVIKHRAALEQLLTFRSVLPLGGPLSVLHSSCWPSSTIGVTETLTAPLPPNDSEHCTATSCGSFLRGVYGSWEPRYLRQASHSPATVSYTAPNFVSYLPSLLLNCEWIFACVMCFTYLPHFSIAISLILAVVIFSYWSAHRRSRPPKRLRRSRSNRRKK